MGKTMWARSLGRHTYWATYHNLATWDKDATYTIMDDFNWKASSTEMKKSWFGAQHTFTMTDKYVRKITIINGKPLIYICNILPWETGNECEEVEWFKANSYVVKISAPLFIQ
jgi:hypothetical protein